MTKKEFDREDPLKKSQHPDQVMLGLVGLIETIGSKKFLTGSGLNRDRDAFVAVLFTYAIRKWTQKEWFIQQVDDPPDFYMISPTNRNQQNKPLDRMGVEVIEIKTEDPEEAINIIKRSKLENYAPALGVSLLVYLNTKNAIRIGQQFMAWAIQNKELFRYFFETYCLFIESFCPKATPNYRVVNIFKGWYQKANLSEEFNKGILFPHPLIDKHSIKIVKDL